MDYSGLLFLFFLLYIGIAIGIGLKFGEIAETKGYDKNSWMIASIFIGLPAWLLVTALPNKRQHEEILTVLRQIKIQGAEENAQSAAQPSEVQNTDGKIQSAVQFDKVPDTEKTISDPTINRVKKPPVKPLPRYEGSSLLDKISMDLDNIDKN